MPSDGKTSRIAPATEQQTINVFAYGSLMYADIFEQVTGYLPSSMTARAHHWQRYALTGMTYPGACPTQSPGGFIDGVLWLNVSHSALDALDQFEGKQYRRVQIEVTALGNRTHLAYIYQWLLPELAQGQWDPDTFDREHRRGFAQIHGGRQD